MHTSIRSNLRPGLTAALGILGMFTFGLSIPKVSELAISLVFVVGAWRTQPQQRLGTSDLITVALLTAFLGAFFVPSSYFGFTDPVADLKEGAVILMCYGSGLFWAREPDKRASSVWMLVALAAGFTLFSGLCTFMSPRKIDSLLDPDRMAPSFWPGGEVINGTALGVYASLGLCLLSVALLWWKDREGRHWFLLRVALFATAAIGFLTNLVMQNRSPYFALGLSFLLCGWVYFRGAMGSLAKRIGGFLLRFSPLLAAALVLAIIFPDFVTGILFRRFGEQGGDTGGRVQAWIAVMQNLPSQPFGGKAIHIGGLRFAHNLWMDAAYNSGLVALLALLLFHLAHLPFIVRFYRRGLPAIELLAATAIGASMFTGCMVEPILDASRLYLGGTCFLLAWMKARSENLDARGRRA